MIRVRHNCKSLIFKLKVNYSKRNFNKRDSRMFHKFQIEFLLLSQSKIVSTKNYFAYLTIQTLKTKRSFMIHEVSV